LTFQYTSVQSIERLKRVAFENLKRFEFETTWCLMNSTSFIHFEIKITRIQTNREY